MRKILTCSFIALMLSVTATNIFAQASKYIGYWEGRIDLGTKPRFILLISDDGKGGLKTIARSPDQVPDDIPCETAFSQDSGITVTITVANAIYKAKPANDTTLQGTFTQNVSFPLNLIKKAVAAGLKDFDQANGNSPIFQSEIITANIPEDRNRYSVSLY